MTWQQLFPEWHYANENCSASTGLLSFFQPSYAHEPLLLTFFIHRQKFVNLGNGSTAVVVVVVVTHDHLHLRRHLLLHLPLRPFLPITSSHQEQGGKKVHTVLWLDNVGANVGILGSWEEGYKEIGFGSGWRGHPYLLVATIGNIMLMSKVRFFKSLC